MSIGICTDMIATWFVYLSISCLLEVKKKWWHKLLLLGSCWLLVIMVIFIGDSFNFPVVLLIFLICVWITCKGSKLKRITIGLMIASVVLAFNGLCDNCVAYFIGEYVLHFRFVVALFLYFIVCALRPPEIDFELSQSLWKLLLVLTFIPLGIIVSLVLFRSPFFCYTTVHMVDGRRVMRTVSVYEDINVTGATVVADTVLFFVTIFSIVGLLWAMKVFYRQQKLEQERTLIEYNKKYYESMEQQQFEIRRLKHDLANHLQTLSALPETEKNHYIQEMIDNPVFSKVLSYSGDATVNAVLTAKESLMRQKGIPFSVKIDISQELPFEKADICALFANALDNAAEGCMNIAEEKRKVELTARVGKGLFVISVKNSCEKNMEDQSKKLPKTTKKDSQNHGFGLRSIQQTVKKYGGNMEINWETELFTLFLYLPMPC